jgi:hypothetical protein
VMNPLLFVGFKEEDIKFGKNLKSNLTNLIYNHIRKVTQNLCSGAILARIRKALVIFGSQRQRQKERRMIRN